MRDLEHVAVIEKPQGLANAVGPLAGHAVGIDRDPRLRRVEGLQRTYFTQAHEIFKELARDGDGVGPRTAALAMFGTINWVSTRYQSGTGQSAAELARDFARLYLDGVLPARGTAEVSPTEPRSDNGAPVA